MQSIDRKTYVAVYERDPYGYGWMVHVHGLDASKRHGGNLPRAMDEIRHELAWRLGVDPGAVRVEDRMPEPIAAVAKRASRARREADRAAARAQQEVAKAVRKLADLGLSRRDSAALLGLSHQRVQQLVAAG